METSIFLAQIIGVVALLKGVALFVKRREIEDILNDFLKNQALLLVTLTFVLVGGLAIVLNHNVWEGGYPVVITIIGWLMIFEGLTFHLLPSKSIAPLMRSLNNKSFYKFAMILSLALGVWFVYVGFFA